MTRPEGKGAGGRLAAPYDRASTLMPRDQRSSSHPAISSKASVGARIRAYREWRGLTRRVLAGLMGRSESWLYQVERGVESRDQRLPWAMLQEIARLLDITVDDLLGDSGSQRIRAPAWPGRVVLCVLPIRCMASPNLDDFLATGLSEDIVARLSKVQTLLIIGPESTRPLVEAGRSVGSIGAELNAQAVLTGSLRELPGERLHLNLHLIDVKTSITVWSDVYDFAFAELGIMQTEVVASVANGLQLRLSPAESDAIQTRSTDVVKAYEFYLRGVGLVATNQRQDVGVGLALFNRAIELDDAFAAAHAYRGYALWRQYFSGWDAGVDTLSRALESVDRALELDATSAVGRLARIRIYWDLGKHEPALAEGLAIYQRDPGSVDAIMALARAYNNAGMAELALPLTERVLALDPSHPAGRKLLIWNQLMVANYFQAATIGNAYLAGHPEDANTAWAVAMAHLQLGQLDAAVVTAEQGLGADRFDFTLWVLLGYVHRAGGNAEAMRQTWRKGTEVVASRRTAIGTNHRLSSWLANLQAGVGAEEEAQATINSVLQVEPHNGYLLYRIAHAQAELGRPAEAVGTLAAAIRAGFLSLQMLRNEEVCAFQGLVDYPDYVTTVAALEKRIDTLRRKYGVPTG